MEPPARFEAARCATRRSRCCGRSRPSTPTVAPRRGARPVRAPAGSAASGCPATARRRASTRAPRPRPTSPCAGGRQLALGRDAVLPAHRQAAAPAGDRDRDPVQAAARTCCFARRRVETLEPNLLVLRIQPDEGVSLRFLAKVPGPRSTCAGEHGLPLRQRVPAPLARGLRAAPARRDARRPDALHPLGRGGERWEIIDPLIRGVGGRDGRPPRVRGRHLGPRGRRPPDGARRPRVAAPVSDVAGWDGRASVEEVAEQLAHQRHPPTAASPSCSPAC